MHGHVFVILNRTSFRARKAARRTRSPEEIWSSNKNTASNENTAGSPFITSPYRSGQEPTNTGHENLAYENDNDKKKIKSNDTSKEKSETQKSVTIHDQSPMEKKNGHAHSTGSDKLNSAANNSVANGQVSKSNHWYEKLHIEDNANVDLANIVIENDPDDSNRYFKKTDMSDWYRLIMKKKPPKDTEKLLDKTNGKGETDIKHKQNSESVHGENDRHKHRSDDKGKSGHRQHKSHTSDKRRRSSEHELSSTLPKTTNAKTTSKEKMSASLPMQSSSTKDKTVNPSPVKQSVTPPPRVIMSRPLSASNSQSASLDHSKTGGTRNDHVTKETAVSQVPVARPRVILSQPKQSPDTDAKDSKLPSQKRPENVPRLNLPK